MSLTTLTFRNGPVNNYQIGLNGSSGCLTATSGRTCQTQGNGTVRIIKAVKFYGTEELCVIGELLSGNISQGMQTSTNSRIAEIVLVESKMGMGAISKPGTKMTLMVRGLQEMDVAGLSSIEFVSPVKIPQERPQGRLIIC